MWNNNSGQANLDIHPIHNMHDHCHHKTNKGVYKGHLSHLNYEDLHEWNLYVNYVLQTFDLFTKVSHEELRKWMTIK